MHIFNLTRAVEQKLLRARLQHDGEAARTAAEIVSDVRRRGDAALSAWVNKLDGVDLQRESLWITEDEIRAAGKKVSREFLHALEHAARNVRRIAEKQLPRPWSLEVEPGVKITQRVQPIHAVGCYIPGGRFALVSTLVMTVVPAKIAGVRNIQVVCPKPNPALLAAAGVLGIKRIARIGGAQAIAALAYGTKRVARVDKIFGPGNRFVTAAKQLVSGDCAIDLPAGPTEAIVLAMSGNPRWIAADLLAQAEHAPDAGSYLVTTSGTLARQVQIEVERQLRQLPPGNPAQLSMKRTGAILMASSLNSACEFINRFAPEHLTLLGKGEALLNQIHSAGTVFLGPWCAQPLGDYATGSNHVLPTGGWARMRGGLSAADFVKYISVQSISRKGFGRLAADVQTLARSEGLLAHANAVEVRR
jgi:histidinol dehydrogenase